MLFKWWNPSILTNSPIFQALPNFPFYLQLPSEDRHFSPESSRVLVEVCFHLAFPVAPTNKRLWNKINHEQQFKGSMCSHEMRACCSRRITRGKNLYIDKFLKYSDKGPQISRFYAKLKCSKISAVWYTYSHWYNAWTSAGDIPQAETEKIVVEKWCYIPKHYKMTELQEDRIKIGKKSIFQWDFVCKFRKFLQVFKS